MVAFPSHVRNAFNGLALAIVRGEAGKPGTITVMAKSSGLKRGLVKIESK
jgi:beta-galactosidase